MWANIILLETWKNLAKGNIHKYFYGNGMGNLSRFKICPIFKDQTLQRKIFIRKMAYFDRVLF